MKHAMWTRLCTQLGDEPAALQSEFTGWPFE